MSLLKRIWNEIKFTWDLFIAYIVDEIVDWVRVQFYGTIFVYAAKLTMHSAKKLGFIKEHEFMIVTPDEIIIPLPSGGDENDT